MRPTFLPIIAALSLFTASAPAADSAGEAKSLFDGKTLAGWIPIGKPGAEIKGWIVKDGVIFHAKGAGGGDIVTTEPYENFELTWEWIIGVAGNSGLKYNLPNPAKDIGCEYQMIDDERHPDGIRGGKLHQTGALYDLIEPSADRKVKPVGEWNESRLVVKGNHVEQWLNGVKTVEFEFGSDDLKARIAKSKYKSFAGFGVKTKSPILLQDHGDEVSVRNIKIRVFDAK